MESDQLGALPSPLIKLIYEHCRLGLVDASLDRRILTRQFLMNLSGTALPEELNRFEKIKKKLCSEDLASFEKKDLAHLAKSILSEKNTAHALAIGGVWITRLLLSPKFISSCESTDIHILVERFKAVSFVLKHEEFESLTKALSITLEFKDHHKIIPESIENTALKKTSTLDALLEKKRRLLVFRAEDSLRALFCQLEQACIDLLKTDYALADKALTVLYQYHSGHMTSMRGDILFRMVDHLCRKALTHQGDRYYAQSALVTWIRRHFPHLNFQQKELERKISKRLFNQQAHHIGYVDIENRCITFVNNIPTAMIEVLGYESGYIFYDEYQVRIGTLSETGHLKRENLFQKYTSALILLKMPIQALESSPSILKLLIQDTFNENALSVLYEGGAQDKLQLILDRLHQDLAFILDTLSQENIIFLVHFLSCEAALSLALKINNIKLQYTFIKQILLHHEKRKALFTLEDKTVLKKIFTPHYMSQIWGCVLKDFFKEKYFYAVCVFLASCIEPAKNLDIFIEALTKLEQEVSLLQFEQESFDAILQVFIEDSLFAELILKQLFLDDEIHTLQELSNPRIEYFCAFYQKCHLLSAIEKLLQDHSWYQHAHYRLILLILSTQKDKLFPQLELRLSHKNTWHLRELQLMSQFVIKHFHYDTSFDEDKALANYLLFQVVIRCANFGDLGFFYASDQQVDDKLIQHKLPKNCVLFPSQASIKPSDTSSPYNDRIARLLKKNNALIDWPGFLDSLLGRYTDDTLPLVFLFLMNYSGETLKLQRWVHDVFEHAVAKRRKTYLYPIIKFMLNYPEYKAADVIFDYFVHLTPDRLHHIDSQIFFDLSSFYINKDVGGRLHNASMHAQFELIRFLGQQKSYEAVHHFVTLLLQEDLNEDNEKKALQILIESKVEGELNAIKDKWYCSIMKYIKRYWYYGFYEKEYASGYVKFCEEETHSPLDFSLPATLETGLKGGQDFEHALNRHHDLNPLRKKYAAFKLKNAALNQLSTNSLQDHGFFESGLFPRAVPSSKPEQPLIAEPLEIKF